MDLPQSNLPCLLITCHQTTKLRSAYVEFNMDGDTYIVDPSDSEFKYEALGRIEDAIKLARFMASKSGRIVYFRCGETLSVLKSGTEMPELVKILS